MATGGFIQASPTWPSRLLLPGAAGGCIARACTKCKTEIFDGVQLDAQAEKYPCCPKCWAEWKDYRVIVINEMRLDMSMPDHRKALRKHEKIFVGVLSPEGGMIDYSNEDNRSPDNPQPGQPSPPPQ